VSRHDRSAPSRADAPLETIVTAVRAHLSRGETKEAVEVAREAHARLSTPASEALAIEAYLARVASLKVRGLTVESKLLSESVRKRFPAAAGALDEIMGVLGIEALVRPLADPNVAPEERARIEAALQKEPDLRRIAYITSLDETHAVRRAAAVLEKAFVAATSGPVTQDALLLPEVSRRSPFAPWKSLVRAIEAYHRRDDAGCLQLLDAIPEGSGPSRAALALRKLVEGKPHEVLGGSAGARDLREALERLEATISSGKAKRIVRAVESTFAIFGSVAPELVPELRQLVSTRPGVSRIPSERLERAMGGPPVRDASYLRLRARGLEGHGSPVLALEAWNELLSARTLSPIEESALLLHMAELLEATEQLDREEYRAAHRSSSPSDLWFLSEPALYERACARDPHSEAFARWLAFARCGEEHTKAADAVALRWRKSLPRDVAPLLYLASSAEERDALVQALGYVSEAEKLDAVNPAVKRARFRLLVATARRHARQRKARLLAKDLAALDELKEAREGRRPALVAALRWVEAALRGDDAGRDVHARATKELLGSEEGAPYLLDALAEVARVPAPETGVASAGALARAAVAATEADLAIEVPARFHVVLERELRSGVDADSCELAALASSLVTRNDFELAYQAAGAGLRRGDALQARFLLLRARSLPAFSRARRRDACAAAAELARRQRDTDFVEEAVELAREDGRSSAGAGTLAPDALDKILAREKSAMEYPDRPSPEDARWICPDCGGMHSYDDDNGDDDFGDEDDEQDDDSGPDEEALLEELERADLPSIAGLPRDIERDLLKFVIRNGGKIPDDPREIARKDPALARRIEAALEGEARRQGRYSQ
jgi:hypothetical protein